MAINYKISFKLFFVFLQFYTFINLANSCQNMLRTGVTYQDQAGILEAHNRLRQSVAQGRVPGQPAAADMQEMKWDSELAARAQAWANSCANGHDDGRHVGRFSVGQNIATTWSSRPPALGSGPDFATQIQAWFDEVRKYGIGSPFSSSTGHYSQLVWGDSNLIGCGFSHWYESQRGYVKMYVCNYGPGGNIIGYNPYTLGQPNCREHGMYPSSRYQGLCDRSGASTQSVPVAPARPSYQPPSDNYIPQTIYKTQVQTASYKPQIQTQVQTYTPFQNLFTFGSRYHFQNSFFSNFFSK